MKEIERKFLINVNKLMSEIRFNIEDNKIIDNYNIEQGYLSKDDGVTIRIRIQNTTGFITIKGKTENISRDEFEYEIPIQDAMELLNMCGKTIIKKRIVIEYCEKLWYIDIFDGDNKGLVIAEIELKDENENFSSPSWLIKEASNDSKYYNSKLINKPYNTWE